MTKTPVPVLERNVEIMGFDSKRKIFHSASIGRLLNDWWRSDDNDAKENRSR
jgi:hypothetical protein